MLETKIQLLDGFVNLDSKSPSGKYYYRITKPKEVSRYICCKIAILDLNDNLIYFDNNSYAIDISEKNDSFEPIRWSTDSNYLFYTRLHFLNGNSVLTDMSIDLKSGMVYGMDKPFFKKDNFWYFLRKNIPFYRFFP